ncbi:MAG: hypothetical protein GWO02_17220, partial [Gammaproteobacteria bacterium]|nr:hypothetical protein [Gammaproteobacteria bacterium]
DAGTICVEGFCRDQTDTCQFNYECAGMSANACVNNGCTAICTDDTDCAGGQTCQGGFCRAASECSSTGDCAIGSHCVDERCLVDCETDPGACGAEEYCAMDGFCRPAWQPEPFCTSDA